MAIFLWGLLILGLLAVTVVAWIYLITRMNHFSFIQKLTKGNRKKSRILGVLVLLLTNLALYLTMGFMNMLVAMIHLLIIWLATDCISRIFKKQPPFYAAGIAALCITIVYLSFGWFQAHHVYRTPYTVSTGKNTTPLKIVMFSDSHVGATFHWQTFSKHIERINQENPDVVIIAGDFVDDETTKEDMEKSCQALGQLKTTYGVFLAFGNHDKGYYAKEHRGYDLNELITDLSAAGVTILQDDVVPLPGNLALIGRKDKSFPEREPIKQLVSGIPETTYTIVIDHQPNDYTAEAEAGAGLVLSGHTHGGQMFPIIHVGEWIGANDRTYGHERRNTTDFIVSSGISDWELKFKTGCKSEYVVIELEP